MSNVYIQEPVTTGKVILNTSYGDLEVELWCKECPKACRNFIQLCLEGYYDGTIFHRVIPGFLVQGGDPTGTGNGGESIYDGGFFKTEHHSRLSFSRRGLLGMASLTDAGEVSSQFFFTLDKASELDRKHTLFGKIVGDTVYNLLRIGEVELEPGSDRPVYPPKITGAQILLNPFEDIFPRNLAHRKPVLSQPKPAATEVSAKVLKNKTLLSFEDEEEEIDTSILSAKFISSHDLLNDPKLSKTAVDTTKAVAKESESRVSTKKEDLSDTYESIKTQKAQNLQKLEETIASVKQEIKVQNAFEAASESNAPVQEPSGKASFLAPKAKKQKSSALSSMLNQYKQKSNVIVGKRKHDPVQQVNTLLTLNAFREKLQTIEKDATLDPTKLSKVSAPEPAKKLEICKLHGLVNCLSCRDTFGLQTEDGPTEEGWLMHRLVFDKESGYKEVREDLTNLVVIDPREKTKELIKNKRP